MCSRLCTTLLSCLAVATGLIAQDKPGTDVLIFTDGEKLIGHLQSATDSKVVFKSDMGFEVTVGWAKIQELHSANKFAAIPKDLTLKNSDDAGKVPQGTLEMTNQKLAVSSTPPQTLPVNGVATVVDEKSFERGLHRQGILEGWKGGATFGLAITRSTVSNQTVTSSLELSRADPSESWIRTRNRTTLTFNSAYGKVTQEGVPDTKISIFHSDLVQDHYLTPRWFAFGGASWDHNYSQGLDLLQAYGGGIGAAVIKNDVSELDVRAGLGFMQQMYSDPTLNKKLIGSRFGENYSRTFAHGITLTEQAGIRPAWNDMKNYFAGFLASLNVPVHRRLGLSITSFDSYVNNPPPYFKKNSFQISVGANFSFK